MCKPPKSHCRLNPVDPLPMASVDDMSAIDEDPWKFMQIKDIEGVIRERLPAELRNLKIIPLWNSDIGTGGHGNIVVLAESVKDFSAKATTGIVVHEAAHAYQQLFPDSLPSGENEEEGADRLACEWGFRDEILLFRDEHDALHKQDPGKWPKIRRPRPL